MASGCVIERRGPRGLVYYAKYRDASGVQVKERLGSPAEGWTRRKADAALRQRLVRVEQEGYKRPPRVSFAEFADGWLADYTATKGLKRSTVESYAGIIENHLKPVFGSQPVGVIDVAAVDKLISSMRRRGYSGATCNRVLNVLSLIEKAAVKGGLHRGGAVALATRPREERRRWRILTPEEVRRVDVAFAKLIAEEERQVERTWLEVSRDVFLVSYGLGLRRGELLGLRWSRVHLADPSGPWLRIEETFVRNRIETPKSQASERTLSLGSRLADVLFTRRASTAYSRDDEYVFAHPLTGRALDPKRYAVCFRRALAVAGIEGYVRPTHDGRHTSITNDAAAGNSPASLMARAGHSDFSTTKRYIDLAGVAFRDEAQRLEERLWGAVGT